MARKEVTYDNIVERLLEEAPGLTDLYQQHVKDYDQLLPHVFFGDLTRYVTHAFQVAAEGLEEERARRIEARKILTVLEEAMSSADATLQELVSVSFVENLGKEDEVYGDIRCALGPNLKQELKRYEDG